jgi:hypothetical protein
VTSLLSRGPLCGLITTTTSTKVLKLEDSSVSLRAGLPSFLTPRRECSRGNNRPETSSNEAPCLLTAVPPMYPANASWSSFGGMGAFFRWHCTRRALYQ